MIAPAPRGRRAAPALLSVLAVVCLSLATLIMIGVCAAGPSDTVVHMPAPPSGPPWWLPLHPPSRLIIAVEWAAVLLGATGVGAGLTALARGARLRPGMVLGGALIAAAVLTVLPPAGSTDVLDYAVYGRIVVLGHDPYVLTPHALRAVDDPVARYGPNTWGRKHSIYGPLAIVEQAAAAVLGGTSIARIAFWLKLWNALAFGAVALALDRLLRGDPARRARAHLLWSANPLLLWGLVAGGHVDALAAGAGFLGLALLPAEPGRQSRPVLSGLAAGALVGAAADIKITFALYGLALAWAARRSWRVLLAVGGGAVGVLVPSYAWFGFPAIRVLVQRGAIATSDNFYKLYFVSYLRAVPVSTFVAVALLAATLVLLLWRLPDGFPALPAVRPALALSLAWLLVWPYQRPWYDAMAFCLLALYPPSRLDLPLLARLAAGSFFYMPGLPWRTPHGWPLRLARVAKMPLVPLVRLGALVAVAGFAVTGRWVARPPAGAPPAGLPAPGPPPPRPGVSARTPAGQAREPAGHGLAGGPRAPGNDGGYRRPEDPPGHG